MPQVKKAKVGNPFGIIFLLPRLAWAAFPSVFFLAALAAFIVFPDVRHRALDSLGYGLIPVALFIVSLALALRHNYNAWVKRFWRAWLGSALLVSIALGIMSMIHISDGIIKDVSYGGRWGQYLGGSPLALGALKVAVLMLLSPLLIFPKHVGKAYFRGTEKFLGVVALTSKRLAVSIKSMVEGSDSEQQETRKGVGVMGKMSSPFTMLWRSLFGGPRPEPADAQEKPVREKPKASPAQKDPSSGWNLPSTELLNNGESQPVPANVLQQMSQQIEKALADHRIDVEVDDVRTGPRIIQFGLVPGWVKLYRNSKSAKSGANEPPPGGCKSGEGPGHSGPTDGPGPRAQDSLFAH